MKNLIYFLVFLASTYLLGCTFHPPTMSDVANQARLSNEEKSALRECSRDIGTGTVAQCQQRAKSWRGASDQTDYSGKRATPTDAQNPKSE